MSFCNIGILYDTSYAKCRRKAKFKELVDIEDQVLLGQIEGFAHAYYKKYTSELTNIKKNDISNIARNVNDKFYLYFGKTFFPSLRIQPSLLAPHRKRRFWAKRRIW